MSEKRKSEVAIKDYLEKQNRPYSAVDIFNNLHKEFGKTAVVKTLETLAEEGKITEKVYGKQKVYAPLQDQYGEFNESEIKALDSKLIEVNESLSVLQQQWKTQEMEINTFEKEKTNNDLTNGIQKFVIENTEISTRIEKLKSGKTVITKEEREKLYKRKENMETFWRKRKRMANDILNSILEGYSKPKKQLLEEAGIETDEEVGIQLAK